MHKKEEIDDVVAWCEQKKKERATIRIIERNPFSFKYDWTRSIIYIEIDKPLALAAKTSLVYDSTAKLLYQFINGAWVPLNAHHKADK